MRLIDADVLKEKIAEIQYTYGDKGITIVDYALDDVIDIINDSPTIQREE